MLYLAEVQKPKPGFNIGARNKPELKLLACQRTEQNWSAIPGEELVAAPDEANNFNPGVLVMVDMNANRQIQSPLRDAGKHLVGILQNLSRQIEKYKKEADEIESWRQSLSLQSQQLQMRQEEIYGREEDLERQRAEVDRLTQQKQDLELTIEQHERSKQELSERWERLTQQEQLLAQQQSGNVAALTEAQVAELRAAVHQLGGGGRSLDPQQMEMTVAAVEAQQSLLDGYWEQLRQYQQQSSTTQAELTTQQAEIDRCKEQMQELQTSLEENQTAWEVMQHTLSMQQEYSRKLTVRIELEQENYQKIYLISKGGNPDIGEAQIDLEELEKMPIDRLQEMVDTLQAEVNRAMEFVHMEEEELHEKQAAIDEIRQKMAAANEFDKLKLEADLHDEIEGYNMLESTMQGQRQTIKERQTYLQTHTRILHQRQGIATIESYEIEWDSVLGLLETQRQHQQSELSQLETDIQNLRTTIDSTKSKIEQQVAEYLQQSQHVQELERQQLTTKHAETELAAKIDLYQQALQPLQDHLNGFKQQLGSIADAADAQATDPAAMQHIESLLNNLVHGEPVNN